MKSSIVLFFTTLFTFISFANAESCRKTARSARINAVGDILIHEALYKSAVKSEHRFMALWGQLNRTLADANLTVGNLEGPLAPGILRGGKRGQDPGWAYDGSVYTGTDMVFNYHPYLAQDLKASGFDLVTTANNHTLDRGAIGVDLTIQNLKKYKLDYVGTRTNDESWPLKVVRAGGLKIGVVACTEATNGWEDGMSQVVLCGSKTVVQLIQKLAPKTDAVIVFPHWGAEYQPNPNSTQRQWARNWIAAGALVVIGNHPHVLQTTEWISKRDGSNGLVIYSLGNFVAGQGDFEKRVTAIAHIDLRKTSSGATVHQFSYTPIVRPSKSASLVAVSENSDEAKHVRNQLGNEFCQ
jgi:Bacterial capsule synthesis protein PGA_cap